MTKDNGPFNEMMFSGVLPMIMLSVEYCSGSPWLQELSFLLSA